MVSITGPELTDYEKEKVEVYCISSSDVFSKAEMMGLKKLASEYSEYNSKQLNLYFNGKSEILLEVTERYYANSYNYKIEELNLNLLTEV